MDKIYKYGDKYYSNTDHSDEVENWGGDLYQLYTDFDNDRTGILCEETLYYSAFNPEVVFDNLDELVEEFFEDDAWELDQIKEAENERGKLYHGSQN